MSINSENCRRFREQLEALGADFDESARRIVSQIANAGMNETVKTTPVGKYPGGGLVVFRTRDGRDVSFHSSKAPSQGGTLRKRWRKKRVRKSGGAWESGYTNNTSYALYVNNGHVIRNKVGGPVKGWVPGFHMLEQGINFAQKQENALFRAEIARIKREGGW